MAELFKQCLFYITQSKKFQHLRKAIDEHCEQEYFNEILSEFYDEISLKGTRLPSEVIRLIEDCLIRSRLLERAEKGKHNSSKERKSFLMFLIDELNKRKESPDGVFVFISRYIASNLHILKKQLKSTYDKFPWEEMEFCLVIFIAGKIRRDSTLISHILLNRDKILRYLNDFNKALFTENSKPKLKSADRIAIKNNVLSIHPQFKELYKDYETLRDVYSLRRMQWYMKVVLSSEDVQIKQHAIERTLQVTGENLKNTPKSPNISHETEKRLLDSAPKQLKTILTSLRNMLSHSAILEKRLSLEKKYNEGIENDLKKVYVEIVIILYEKLKNVLEENKHVKLSVDDEDISKLIFTKEYEKIGQLLEKLKLKHPEDAHLYDSFHYLTYKKIVKMQRLRKELHPTSILHLNGLHQYMKVDDKKVWPKFIESLWKVLTEKLHSNPRELKSLVSEVLTANVFELNQIKSIDDYKEDLEENIEKKIERIERYSDNRLSELIKITSANDLSNEMRMISVEMLLLDLLEILMTTYKCTDNTSYLDRPAPLLVGKNMRNYLAHGNPLVDILSFDPRNSIEIHCTLFKEKSLIFLEGINYAQNVNFTLKSATETYHKRLAIVENQAAMFEAARQGNMRKTEECVLKGADPSAYDVSGESGLKCAAKSNNVGLFIYFFGQNIEERVENLLEIAAENGCDSIMEYLLENNHVKEYVQSDNNLLHLAVFNGRRSMVRLLLSSGCKANVIVDEKTPLHLAALKSFDAITEILINSGALISFKDNLGEQPLHAAAVSGSWKCAEMFLNMGAEINARNNDGYTALHLAAHDGHAEFVENLIQRGATTNDVNNLEGVSALHLAASNGHEETVQVLLKHKAQPRIKTKKLKTPLHVATCFGHRSTAELLLKCGASALDQDSDSWMPLHFAALQGWTGFVAPFMQAVLETKHFPPLLHLAACSGNTETVKVVLDCGNVAIDSVQVFGRTPLYLAAFLGNADVVEFLIKAGATINVLDEQRDTAFLTAIAKGHCEVVVHFLQLCKVSQQQLDYGLYTAILYEHDGLVEILLKAGGDPNFQAQIRCTNLGGIALPNHQHYFLQPTERANLLPVTTTSCLAAAVMVGSVNAVKLLLGSGANVINATVRREIKLNTSKEIPYTFNYFLKTERLTTELLLHAENCLHIASQCGRTEIIDLLLKQHGADKDVKDSREQTPLYYAVSSNDKKTVQLLLKAGADPNATALNELTLLHKAALNGFVRIARLLIRHGANIHTKCNNASVLEMAAFSEQTAMLKMLLNCDFTFKERYMVFQKCIVGGKAKAVELLLKKENANDFSIALFNLLPPLHSAVYHGKKEILEILLNHHFEVNARFPCKQFTALHLAASKGLVNVTETLLKYGADVNLQDEQGMSSLHQSVQKENSELVDLLIKNGADVNLQDKEGKSPLHWAVCVRNAELPLLLIRNKADVNLQDEHGMSPLHRAVIKQNLQLVQALTTRGCEVNLRDKQGRSPLDWAVLTECVEVIQCLIRSGADVNVLAREGMFPLSVLYCCTYAKNNELLQLLLKNAGDLNVQDDQGRSSLHWAVLKDYGKLVPLLIGSGADVNLQDKKGMSPLHCVVYVKNTEWLQLLIKNKADVNLRDEHGMTSLHCAVLKQSTELVHLLTANGSDVNLRDNQGRSPLDWAVRTEYVEVVQLLIENGAVVNNVQGKGGIFLSSSLHYPVYVKSNELLPVLLKNAHGVNLQDEQGRSSLHWVVLKGDAKSVQLLIESGADVNLQDKEGMSPLHCAVCVKNTELLQLLTRNKADRNLQDEQGLSPLHWAVLKQSSELVQLLTTSGCDVNLRDKQGRSPLDWAIHIEYVEMVQFLIESGAVVNSVRDKEGTFLLTPLYYSMYVKNNELLQLLFKNTGDVNLQDKQGRSSLHLAVQKRHVKSVQLLIKNGANVNLQDKKGMSPLHCAVYVKSTELAQHLIKNRSDVNLQDKQGKSPLHWAVTKGNIELVQLLIRNGSYVNLQDRDGMSPIHYAMYAENTELVQYLIENGADLNIQDKKGISPLHCAVYMENTELFQILTKNGADGNLQDKEGVSPLHLIMYKRKRNFVNLQEKKGMSM